MRLNNSIILTRSNYYIIYSLNNGLSQKLNKRELNSLLLLLNCTFIEDIKTPFQKKIFNKLKDFITIGSYVKPLIKNENDLEKVTIEVCQICNLSCKHCYLGEIRPTSIMRNSTFFTIIDQIKKVNATAIGITGGEPFLDHEIFTKIKYAKDNGIAIAINSNGLLIDDTIAKRIKELDVYKVSLTLSEDKEYFEYLYGLNTYDKVITTLQLLNDYNIPISIKCLSTDNYKQFLKFRELMLNQYNISSITSHKVQKIGKVQHLQDSNIAYDTSYNCDNKKATCKAGIRSLFINCTGNIKKCVNLDEVIGNIHDSSLIDLL